MRVFPRAPFARKEAKLVQSVYRETRTLISSRPEQVGMMRTAIDSVDLSSNLNDIQMHYSVQGALIYPSVRTSFYTLYLFFITTRDIILTRKRVNLMLL